MKNTQLDDLLNYDGLKVAEELTGESYKNDKGTQSLGFLGTIINGQEKRAALSAINDTHFGMDFNQIFPMLKEEGFEQLGQKTTKRQDKWSDTKKEEVVTQYYYWHPTDKVFVSIENYDKSFNSGKMHYCIKTEKYEDLYNVTSSGGWDSDTNTWNGDHDIREGFRHNLNKIREVGELVDWNQDHFLWLLTYMESDIDGYDYEEITNKVLGTFPKEVLNSMNIKL